jgi:hypothetical protein
MMRTGGACVTRAIPCHYPSAGLLAKEHFVTGIIFIDASLVRRRWLSRRRFTAAATGMLAAAAVPTLRHARGQVTPEPAAPGVMSGPDPLFTLLSLVPQRLVTAGESGISFFYANLAEQFRSLGLDQERLYTDTFVDATEDPAIFQSAIAPLATASEAFSNALDDDYTGSIGFQPLLVGGCLVAGTPPDQLSLFHGGIDLDALPEAWEASGYERKQADNGAEIWTIGEEGEVDVSRDPFISPSFNNVTVLDSGVVVFGQFFDTVAEAVDLEYSWGGSLRADPSIAEGVSGLSDTTVSAIGIRPQYLDSTSAVRPREQNVLEDLLDGIGEMPAWSAMIVGITGGFTNPPFVPENGGTPVVTDQRHAPVETLVDGAIMVRLVTGSKHEAAEATDVVVKRWNSWNSAVINEPFTELMTVVHAWEAGKNAKINFIPVKAPSVWIDLVLQRDLLPFAFAMSPGDDEATPAG